jgi:hypothetical protein
LPVGWTCLSGEVDTTTAKGSSPEGWHSGITTNSRTTIGNYSERMDNSEVKPIVYLTNELRTALLDAWDRRLAGYPRITTLLEEAV